MKRQANKVVLLSGGNPQIAKGYGDEPLQAYIAAMPGWKRDVGKRLDALIARTVPGMRKAVKWNSPFYGVKDGCWFLSFHCFTKYVKVTFFRGRSLRPVPPGTSKHKDVRYLDIFEDGLDEAQFTAWVKWRANCLAKSCDVLLSGRGDVEAGVQIILELGQDPGQSAVDRLPNMRADDIGDTAQFAFERAFESHAESPPTQYESSRTSMAPKPLTEGLFWPGGKAYPARLGVPRMWLLGGSIT